MPVVTAILGPTFAPAADAVERFTIAVTQHCLAIMHAPPDKVQVQVLQAIAPLHGAPVYLQVQYRHQPSSEAAMMDIFMAALEAACIEAFQATPRLRCFPQHNDQLFARN